MEPTPDCVDLATIDAGTEEYVPPSDDEIATRLAGPDLLADEEGPEE